MIHTLNSGDLLTNGIQTLVFFVENIIKDPKEEKFKKIRVNNAGVQKKVIPLIGGVEFLEIVGFSRIKDESGISYIYIYCVNIEKHYNCYNIENCKVIAICIDSISSKIFCLSLL